MENIFVEFLPPWIETGLQPAFYDKESGTALQQTARMYARVNMLIRIFNKLSKNTKTTVEDYINQFNELRDYVHDYFANLDLQTEVNHKIDEMASNGSLTQIIGQYVNPMFYEFTDGVNQTLETINNTVNTQNNTIRNIDNKVNSATSGSPKGVYATVSDLETADPNHNYIYVVTEDGKWYYYDTTEHEWTAGGTYQASEGVVLTDDTTNLLDESKSLYEKYIGGAGTIYDNRLFNVSDYIPVEEGEKYTFLMPVHGFLSFNSGKSIVHFYNDSSRYPAPYVFTVPSGVAFLRLNYYNANLYPGSYQPMVVKGEVSTLDFVKFAKKIEEGVDLSNENYDSVKALIEDSLYPTPSVNLVDENDLIEGYYINSQGQLDTNVLYKSSKLTAIDAETTYYTNTFIKCMMFYDEFGNPDVTHFSYDGTNPGTFTTPAGAVSVVFSFNSGSTGIMINKGNRPLAVQPYEKMINQNIGLTTRMKSELLGFDTNILSGKKWVACGDSFTSYTNAYYNSGVYSGKAKTYPYLIGLRNDMTIVNLAVGGSTMAREPGADTRQFSVDIYNTIPNDADYITIKYGINDGTHGIPVGTINDTTDTTFYGAWNKVMNYIIIHHPLAKIGIIVTNGLNYINGSPEGNPYAKATMDIARKFGIPTLNEWNDPEVPLLTQTGRVDVDSSIRSFRDTTFKISSTDRHPNYQCQEYESVFIEDFLKRL